MSSSKEKRSKDLDNTTYPSKRQHLDNDMDRNFSFEEIDPDIEPDIEFDKINDEMMIILTITTIKLIGIKIKIKQKIKDHQF